MSKKEIILLISRIKSLTDSIPTPPPGRELAVVKTNLDQARLWAQEAYDVKK